jgi:hypothetical protein
LSMCFWSHVGSVNLLKQYVHSRFATPVRDITLA